jgi:signal transduction histidine kinase
LRFYREPSQPIATDIAAVLDSVLKLYSPRLASAGIVVQTEQRCVSASVLSSPGELRQVIANLVGNAIDAMRSGGGIRVRISQQRNAQPCCSRIRLTIGDTGMGIPNDVLPTIFEPFITTKGETGTGLGLWVTSENMKRNGWKINVHSSRNPSHRGTTFSIVIPVPASTPP